MRKKYPKLSHEQMANVVKRMEAGEALYKIGDSLNLPIHEMTIQLRDYNDWLIFLHREKSKVREEVLKFVDAPFLTINDVVVIGSGMYCKESLQPVDYSDIANRYVVVQDLEVESE